jgi:hypothetical protein
MTIGDKFVTAVDHPTATTLSAAFAVITNRCGLSGAYGMVNYDNCIFVWGNQTI